MRSLAVKLTLAFLFVSLIGAILVGVIINRRTQSAFDRFMLNRYTANIAAQLAEYYEIHDSWIGVISLFRQGDDDGSSPGGKSDRNTLNSQTVDIILVGPQGKVIYGTRGEIGAQVPRPELSKAYPIKVDNEVVGYLLPRTIPHGLFGGSTPEEIFLTNVNQAIFLGALATVVIAIVLGGLLSYTLTRQLRELTAGTERVADGDLGYQVEVRSNDELGELAKSFNQMSSDLDRSNQARKQMTADIAHDLRSPLSVILGYTEALSDKKLAGTPEIYDVMYREAGQLSHLIDDLRTLSLADAGELSLNMQPVSPGEILEDTRRAFQHQAGKMNISLDVAVEPDTPKITVDPNRMTQVLSNLVSNALRYTPEGGNVILGTRHDQASVTMFVRDSGDGISAQDLPKIFNRFYRSDKSRSHGGEVGLGLAIAKSLVNAQGGEISVESIPGETTFSMVFQV